jgi:hypothetical protein
VCTPEIDTDVLGSIEWFLQTSMCAGATRALFLVATLSSNLVRGADEIRYKAAQAIFDDAGFSGYVR